MDLFDRIHMDGKWFYMTRVKRNFYVCLDDERPHRERKSKRFITKVMFMAAVARFLWDTNIVCVFDGKIGIQPFVFKGKAKRKRKNRLKGTLETKCIDSVIQSKVRKIMFQKLRNGQLTMKTNLFIFNRITRSHIQGRMTKMLSKKVPKVAGKSN